MAITFPGSNHAVEEYQQKPVFLLVDRAFDLSMQDEQLVAQQHVFCQKFGFASGQSGELSEHTGGRQWFDPPQTRSGSACKRIQTHCLIEVQRESTNGPSSS
jgi:hypothetical protein